MVRTSWLSFRSVSPEDQIRPEHDVKRESLSHQATVEGVARSLLLDRAAVECISALNTAGIRAILLKGPVTAQWLYADGTPRPYLDVDLLVPPQRWRQARSVLERLGYRDAWTGMAPHEFRTHVTHAHPLRLEPVGRQGQVDLPSGVCLDLHRSFHGIGAPDETFWRAVAEDTERIYVAGTNVEVPGEVTRALLLALHAASAGTTAVKRRDLERALEQVEDDVWRDAHRLAVELDAVSRLLAGLGLLPQGAELIERLALNGEMDVPSALYVSGIPPVAEGLERLRTATGLMSKARFLVRELVPTAAFMRMWGAPVARRGRLGLLLAYAYRPFWLLGKLPEARRAYIRARRAADMTRPSR
jgi:hypothetical protein